MTAEMARAERARALADWFRTNSSEAGDLMARAAKALERIMDAPGARPSVNDNCPAGAIPDKARISQQ